MSRWKAAAIHLLISALVVGSVVLAITLIWYPPAIWHMAAADKLLGLIVLVDLVVGPLLTLLVYRHGKPGLRFDLSIIAIVQIVALCYALHTTWITRPVFIVGNHGVFNLVFANEITPADLAAASQPEFRHLPLLKPKLVGARLPLDQALRNTLLFESLSGRDLPNQPRYFVPYADVALGLAQSATDKQQKTRGGFAWLPYVSSRGDAFMLIEAGTGNIIGPVATTPDQSN